MTFFSKVGWDTEKVYPKYLKPFVDFNEDLSKYAHLKQFQEDIEEVNEKIEDRKT